MPGDLEWLANQGFGIILQAVAVFIILFELYKKVKEVRKESKEANEWELRVKKAVETVESKEKEWDEALAGVKETRAVLAKEFNERLDKIERQIGENHTDTEAKIQEIRAEQEFSMEIYQAMLEGLSQLGSNGPVSDMKERLYNYLNKETHK